MPGLALAQADIFNHITLRYSVPEFSSWLSDPRLLSPAWEANPAGLFTLPYFRIGISGSMSEFREGSADLRFKEPEGGSGFFEDKTVPANISVMYPATIENAGLYVNFETFGLSMAYLGEQVMGIEYVLEDSRIELGHFTAEVDDTLTAAEVEGLKTWVPVTWKLNGTGYGRITGSGKGDISAMPFQTGLGLNFGKDRLGFGFRMTRFSGGVDFRVQVVGDTFSARPTVDVHRDSVAWDAELYGRIDNDSILFWRQEMALNQAWAYAFTLGYQHGSGPFNFGAILSFKPGFTLTGSATDIQRFLTNMDTNITNMGIDPDYSYLYAYTRHDTVRIDGNAWLRFLPEYTTGYWAYEQRPYAIPVPTRWFAAGGAAWDGQVWVFDLAGGMDILPWGNNAARELYAAVSAGRKIRNITIRTSSLYQQKTYTVGDQVYTVPGGFVGVNANLRSGPLVYGLGLRTGMPEFFFDMAERAQGVLDGGIKRKSALVPGTISLSVFFIPEEEW